MNSIKFGVLTVSDSCYKEEGKDKSGPEVVRLISTDETEIGKILNGHVCFTKTVPDEESAIREHLVAWSTNAKVDVILTVGGTGFSVRDITPDVTKTVIDKEAPAMALAMLVTSLKITPMAMLSRAVCGIRSKTLIINLPGSPKAAKECLDIIAPVIPHAVDLLRDTKAKIKSVHDNIINNDFPPTCSYTHSDKTLVLTERFRKSPYPMVSMEKALELIRKHAVIQKSEFVSVENAGGRILATDVYSEYDLPPFRASVKDGYAVLASDGKGRSKVLGGLKAGTPTIAFKLVPGSCVRVNTGAPIPENATAVVQVEDTKLLEGSTDGTEEKEIEILTDIKVGQDIRPIGCDIQKGELILKSHTKLGAVELGLLAACGHERISVIKLPSVGVLSTGDELQCAGTVLMSGHVYDSNKVTLLSLLKEYGFNAVDMGIAQDNETIMIKKIQDALAQVDVLITSGSVSMGDRDMLKFIIKHYFNATIHFGRVNMKPGKPTTFASCIINDKKKYLLCLPGNPVSATVTMHLFALPLLKYLTGDNTKPVIVKTKLTSSYNLDPRPEYARATLKWDNIEDFPKAYSTGNQISSKLLSCKNANALLVLPACTAERAVLHAGDVVSAILLSCSEYV